jgi:hypothetical protein
VEFKILGMIFNYCIRIYNFSRISYIADGNIDYVGTTWKLASVCLGINSYIYANKTNNDVAVDINEERNNSLKI